MGFSGILSLFSKACCPHSTTSCLVGILLEVPLTRADIDRASLDEFCTKMSHLYGKNICTQPYTDVYTSSLHVYLPHTQEGTANPYVTAFI